MLLQRLRRHVGLPGALDRYLIGSSAESSNEESTSGAKKTSKYLALHLRFEIDMVAHSLCEFGGGEEERHELEAYREIHFPALTLLKKTTKYVPYHFCFVFISCPLHANIGELILLLICDSIRRWFSIFCEVSSNFKDVILLSKENFKMQRKDKLRRKALIFHQLLFVSLIILFNLCRLPSPEELRSEGLCPLTPEEAILMLTALGFRRKTHIFVAGSQIYGGQSRLGALTSLYPNLVTKEKLLSSTELEPFVNYSSQVMILRLLLCLSSLSVLTFLIQLLLIVGVQ